jgi:hypothetical protein
MPSVIAFQRNPGGDVTVIVGEAAENLNLMDNADVRVVPNIKRWAMSSDSHVQWHMKARSAEWPTWWDPSNRSVNVWGQAFPVRDIIGKILARAFDEAGIEGQFEWRAGCPVHAGLDYRSDLTHVLSELAGQGSINWVVEEPLLLLALGHRERRDQHGSYLIYDLGGGSFDCALATVHDNGEMIVYGADGHPLIGGVDIDDILTENLVYTGYTGSQTNIRAAKEVLAPGEPDRDLLGGFTLSWEDVESALSKTGILRKTPMSLRDAYVAAKGMWKRDEIDNEVLTRDPTTGAVRFVWQSTFRELSEEVDNIILYGGPIKSSFVTGHLKEVFGDKAKVASEWLESDDGVDIPDAELLGVSMGACYFADRKSSALYVNRLPARITLENLQTGESIIYEPFEHLSPPNKPFNIYVSKPLMQEKNAPQEYELTVTSPDGVVWERHTISGYLEQGQEGSNLRLPATSLRLVIDQFGRVGVEKHSSGPGLPWTKVVLIVESPPWQTDFQKESAKRGYPVEEFAGELTKIKDSSFAEGYRYSPPAERRDLTTETGYPRGRGA